MNNVYQLITDKIIELLEEGTVPWHKPWSGADFAPQNLTSGKPYRGINAFLLGCMPYDSPYWLTFNQAKKLKGRVKKGEQSMPVIFWKWHDKKDSDADECEKIPVLRYYRVFHVTQCDLPECKVPKLLDVTTYDFLPIERCEQLLDEMPIPPKVQHVAHAAVYNSKNDTISLPLPERFERPEDYYSTRFHETIHATGHAKRLNRDGIVDGATFGSPKYAKEELVAELGASFLCGECRIENPVIENSAAYIQTWLKRLRDDNKLVIHAAAQAQKAADHILNRTFGEAEQETNATNQVVT